MVNPVANAQGDPNSATPHAMRALRHSGPKPATVAGTASTTSTANVTTAGAMIVPVAAITNFIVGMVVLYGGDYWVVQAVGPGNQLTLRIYSGTTSPPGTVLASGSQVLQQV